MNPHVIHLYKELRAEQFTNLQIIAMCRRFLKILWLRPHGELYTDLMHHAQQQELATPTHPLNAPFTLPVN